MKQLTGFRVLGLRVRGCRVWRLGSEYGFLGAHGRSQGGVTEPVTPLDLAGPSDLFLRCLAEVDEELRMARLVASEGSLGTATQVGPKKPAAGRTACSRRRQ